MLIVAGKATEALVNSDGSAIVAGSDLSASVRSMALIAERLAPVGTDADQAISFMHLRQRQVIQRNVVLLAAVEECE